MTTPVRTVDHVQWGVADMWTGDADETEPTSTATLSEPASGFTGIGYTAEGMAFSIETTTEEATVEEELLAVGEDTTGVVITVTMAFAEDTFENRVLAIGNAELTTTAAGVGQIGKKTLTIVPQKKVISFVAMAKNGYGFKDRLYFPRMIATGTVETAFRRSPSEKRLIPVTFKAIGSLDTLSMIQQTAAATS